MKGFIIALAILAGLELVLAKINSENCGGRPLFKGKVVGGNESAVGDHPWQIAMFKRSSSTGPFSFSCGGSIIDEYTILTAAHCTISSSVAGNYLIHRTHNRVTFNDWAQTRNVVKIVNHPSYSRLTKENDISLLFVDKPFDFSNSNVAPVCLALKNPNALDISVATGFGTLSSGGSSSSVIREVYINITSDADATTYYGNSYYNTTMIAAAHQGDGKDTCQGDSGGPLSVAFNSTTGFKKVEQVGITSWGRGCGDIGVYARVPTYISWIEKQISDFQPSRSIRGE